MACLVPNGYGTAAGSHVRQGIGVHVEAAHMKVSCPLASRSAGFSQFHLMTVSFSLPTCLFLCRTCCPRNHGMAKQAGNQNSCPSSANWSGRTWNVTAFVAMRAQNTAANLQTTSKGHRLHQIHSDTIGVGWARNESPDSSQNIKLHWICWEALWGCGQDRVSQNPQKSQVMLRNCIEQAHMWLQSLSTTTWYVPSRYACKNPEVCDSLWVCIWYGECVP